jgi:Mn2+/Fe2+ NRAMP family transporter
MLMTNRQKIMGDKRNTLLVNIFGWTTTAVMFAATGALIYTWVAG